MSREPLDTANERLLLQSVVAVARHAYSAAASSIFMISRDTGELVFAAVAGAGQQSLIGLRFPPGTGIAGWVAASCQTLIADDVTETDRFARDAAASTGYLPTSIMAAPLIADGECIGVLEVLDRYAVGPREASGELDDMELLGLLATQAALSLAMLRRSELGTRERPRMGTILQRLSEHATADANDPLAVALLGVSLDLLERDRSASVSH